MPAVTSNVDGRNVTGGVVSDETTDLNVTRTAALVDVGADVGDDAVVGA